MYNAFSNPNINNRITTKNQNNLSNKILDNFFTNLSSTKKFKKRMFLYKKSSFEDFQMGRYVTRILKIHLSNEIWERIFNELKPIFIHQTEIITRFYNYSWTNILIKLVRHFRILINNFSIIIIFFSVR